MAEPLKRRVKESDIAGKGNPGDRPDLQISAPFLPFWIKAEGAGWDKMIGINGFLAVLCGIEIAITIRVWQRRRSFSLLTDFGDVVLYPQKKKRI